MTVQSSMFRKRRGCIALILAAVLLALMLSQLARSGRIRRVRQAILSQGANATTEFDGPQWLDDLLWKVPSLHQRFESRFRSISYGERNGQTFAPTNLSYLPDVPELEGLSLDHATDVGDGQLVYVGQLRRLKKLSIDGPLVTNEGVRHLAQLAELEELCLENTQVTDDGLRILQSMPRLNRLLLPESSAITGEGLTHLSRDCRLEDLWLQNTRFDHGLDHIDVTRLNRLIATDTPLTDAGLEPLREAVNLEQLWIARTQITDAGLLHLGGLPRLVTIQLQGTRITDTGLEHLSGLKSLQILIVTGTDVTETGAQRLATDLPTLEIGIGPSRKEMRWVRGTAVSQ